MAQIFVHPPDGAPAEEVSLPAGEALLVGREPVPEAGALVRTLVVASKLVSSNHVKIWSDAEGLHARDLNSKNGTFVRIERGAQVSLAGGEAHLFLAQPRTPAATAPSEVAVAGVDAAELARRIQAAAAEWSARHGLDVHVAITPDGAPFADGRFGVPIADGFSLEVAGSEAGRTQGDLDGAKAALFPYVFEQVARWRAVRAAVTRKALAFSAPGAERALRQVLEAARARMPLVLRGETGTGKTELAAIYAEAFDPGRPFVTVHCAQLDPQLAHSALFGAIKGSYTSSDRTISGAVKLADGGTLFLDDVDLLPPEVQAKLLHFLDQGRYEPLGHGQATPLTADVRVVAGTNQDLGEAVRGKRFREDLYWRLHTGAVAQLPPLRERPEDVEQLLAARGVRERLDPGALQFLVRGHGWRGNFRECLRFCGRVLQETRVPLDRRRCEEILGEASLEPGAEPVTAAAAGGATFDRALAQALSFWLAEEGAPPERFDELGRFVEGFLKSSFVAHALALEDSDERPESFDRDRRQRLGCDLTTLKRKMDDYLALKERRKG